MAVYDRWHLSHPPEDAEPCKCGRGKNKLFPSKDHPGRKNAAGKVMPPLPRWQVRWYDDDGKQCKRNFERKGGGRGETDPEQYAEAWDAKVNADLNSGSYIDPAAGQVSFRVYAEQVIADRTLDERTRQKMRGRLSNHVYPYIGDAELRELSRRPTKVQNVIRRMEKAGLDDATISVVMAHVGVVFSCALDDEKIAKNPMRSKAVVVPRPPRKKVTPWTGEQVCGMRDELPEQLAATVDAGAGLGLRQGEILALSPDDVDWLRGVLTVRRQVKVMKGGMVFALPKGEKIRELPLPESVKLALSEHMRRFPPQKVTLPWKTPDGDPVTARVFFPHPAGRALHPDRMNDAWRPALVRCGMVPCRDNGMHALRHYFASVLLTEGEAPQAVSEWMGHASPMVTMQIYAHLMPKSEDRMRSIIDRAMDPAFVVDQDRRRLAIELDAVRGRTQSALDMPQQAGNAT